MAYSSEVYAAAKRILEERRTGAQRLAELKKADVYAKIPEIRRIDSELSRRMANLSVLVLRGGKDLDPALADMKAANAEIEQKRSAILSENGLPKDNYPMQLTLLPE